MRSLVDSMTGDHPARPVLVLSNVADAKGLNIAKERGVPTAVVDHWPFGGDRAAFEAAMAEVLNKAQPDIICLAGFMRILTEGFVSRYLDKILNIHPSLLPKYKGLDTHARALAAGDKEAGCTVHLVTRELDQGPILGQAKVAIQDHDTAESLAARVLEKEHILYPKVLHRFSNGDINPLLLT